MLAFPELEILRVTSTTYIEILARLYEHIGGGNNIYDWGMFWKVSCEPDIDGNVVGGIAISDRQETMDTEQELASAVIER